MSLQVRIDRGSLRPAKRLADGRVRADAHLTRAGVFEYANPDGSLRREYRPPEEVFSPESLESFAQVPVTNDHPPALIDSKSARQYMVGATGENVVRDDDYVRGSLLVADEDTVGAMIAGKLQVSCGYTCDYDATPGVLPDGTRYDGVQRNIRGNHVAIVHSARAGENARVRMDGASIQTEAAMLEAPEETEDGKKKKKKGDKEEEAILAAAAEQVTAAEKRADAAESKLAAEKARADAAEGERDSLKTRLKQMEATRIDQSVVSVKDLEITQLKQKLASEKARADAAEDPTRLAKAVAGRHSIEVAARMVMPDLRFDDLDDRTLMCAVVEKLHGVTLSKDHGNEYVRARFDAAVEGFKGGEAALEKLREAAAEKARVDAQPRTDAQSARDKMIATQRSACTPYGKTT